MIHLIEGFKWGWDLLWSLLGIALGFMVPLAALVFGVTFIAALIGVASDMAKKAKKSIQ